MMITTNLDDQGNLKGHDDDDNDDDYDDEDETVKGTTHQRLKCHPFTTQHYVAGGSGDIF